MKNLFNKISIHPFFYLLLLLSFFCGLFKDIICLFIILFIHEIGHISMSLLFKWNIKEIKLNITGGEISNNSCINLYEECPAILVSSGTLNISGTTTTISNNTYGISDDTLENQGASIYNKSGTVTILGTTLDQGNKFTQNIVNGVKEDVQNSGGGYSLRRY